jgi:hypothetical protein
MLQSATHCWLPVRTPREHEYCEPRSVYAAPHVALHEEPDASTPEAHGAASAPLDGTGTVQLSGQHVSPPDSTPSEQLKEDPLAA